MLFLSVFVIVVFAAAVTVTGKQLLLKLLKASAAGLSAGGVA